jgi:replicative DNA helicase
MLNAVKELTPNYQLGGTDLIADGTERLNNYIERLEHQDDWYFTTGFPELDDLIHGIQRGEELFVIFARTNQGKSWVLEKMITHIWQLGFNVGYISPEMSADSIGYRFDTLYKNFSNKDLVWGKTDIDLSEYSKHIHDLQEKKNKFIVSTPIDFDRKITVTKLRNFVKQHKLDAIAIDGITYMTDERGKRGDNKTTSLTNISEDLMLFSVELKIPILVVVQANRSGVVDADTGGTPELESIRDSDGISHNASKVLSIRQDNDGVLEMGIKKQRFGVVGGKLKYQWDINRGIFDFIPNYDDAQPREATEEKIKTARKNIDKVDVF